MNKLIVYISLLLSLFISCKKQEVGPQLYDKTDCNQVLENHVLILNEGTFGQAKATLSNYDKLLNTTNNNLFSCNNNFPLGDVLNSAIKVNGKLYLVVNNSKKIEVVDSVTLRSVATISGFASPRYILPINNSKAYVSNLFSNNLDVVDLQTNSIAKQINVGGRTEQMLLTNNKLYVTKYAGELLKINPETDIIEDTLQLTIGCQNIVKDKNNKLWVLCDGSFPGDPNQTTAILYKIDAISFKIEQSFAFASTNDSPAKLTIDASGNSLFWLNNGVFKMNISDATLPTTAIINSDGRTFYGLGIEPNTNNIYVADAVDFVQQGRAYVYTSNGTELTSFDTGIIPNGFLF